MILNEVSDAMQLTVDQLMVKELLLLKIIWVDDRR